MVSSFGLHYLPCITYKYRRTVDAKRWNWEWQSGSREEKTRERKRNKKIQRGEDKARMKLKSNKQSGKKIAITETNISFIITMWMT